MRSFKHQQRFPHSADHVLKQYCDPRFLASRHGALGHQDVAVLEHSAEGARLRVRLSFMQVTQAGLPAFARRLVKKRTQILQSLEWNHRQRRGRIVIDARGVPMKVEGELRLSDCAGGCVASVAWKVHCPLPLVGPRIESLAQEMMLRMAEQDQAVTARLLAQGAEAAPRPA